MNSYLFVSGVEIYKFKAKDSEINAIPLCLGNIWKYFLVKNMKKTGLNGYVYDFSVDYDANAVDNILDIHKYLMKKHDANVNGKNWLAKVDVMMNLFRIPVYVNLNVINHVIFENI